MVDFAKVTDGPGAQRGDLFVTANESCGLLLSIEDHETRATAFDLTATWRRL